MLYKFQVVKDTEQYYRFHYCDGVDAWWMFKKNRRDIWYLISHNKVYFGYRKERPNKWFSIHYGWYDCPLYSVWFWRFNLSAC